MVEKYLRIKIHSLHPLRPTTFDTYVHINDKFILYLRAGDALTADKIEKLSGADVFFIREEDRPAYKKYVHTQMNDELLNVDEKARILRESSYYLVEELFENPDVNEALDQSRELISNFVQFMSTYPDGMANLIGLSSHDFYTYNHSLDVCIYSLGLGRAAGYLKKEELEELGKGALFHDLGKRHVNPDIICKNGPLDDIEWAQMKKHPLYGLQILNNYPSATDGIKACVFEHHENHVGNGYPQQLSGAEIHPMARIVAITDCYDAMTTKRTYSEPMRPSEALTMMKEKIAGRFDPDLLNAMHSVLFKLKI
ncbi:MAG: HD domain-containing phosphohydrolase [Bdellovibrionia bacterium]